MNGAPPAMPVSDAIRNVSTNPSAVDTWKRVKLTMLAYTPRPSRTADTMVAKLSSVRTMRGGFLGHLRPGHAHRDADVGLAQGGRVVDAVAGHGDHLAACLQHPDDPDLVAR